MKSANAIRFMQSSWGVLVLVLSTATLEGAQGKLPWDASAAARGERSYRTYCAACHGATAEGDGPLAKDLKVQPAKLTEIARRREGKYPFELVVKIIDGRESVPGHGTTEMPAWGDAFRTTDSASEAKERMEQLAHYLWSLQIR